MTPRFTRGIFTMPLEVSQKKRHAWIACLLKMAVPNCFSGLRCLGHGIDSLEQPRNDLVWIGL